MKSYKDLDVWKQGRALVKAIYLLTKKLPADEKFGLTSQLRRAAVSVPFNIAEGCGRNHLRDSLQFFYVSRGSLYELETQVIVANDLQYISEKEANKTLDHINKCLQLMNGFIRYFENKLK